MGARGPRKVVLDAGALAGIERGDPRMSALLEASTRRPVTFLIPAGVLAQTWRDGGRQTRMARFLKAPAVEIVPLTEERAKAAGVLCGLSKTRDVIGASVVIVAREQDCPVVTSDRADLAALDPALELHVL